MIHSVIVLHTERKGTMAEYSINVHFYCPRNMFEINLYQLRSAAESFGIGYEVLVTRQFRNPQRFWAAATEALVRFEHDDPILLDDFVSRISPG